jgi:hypothetical protein
MEAKSMAERTAEEDYARWLMVEFAGEFALCEQMGLNATSARNAEREYAIWEEIVVIGDVGREKVLEREGRVRKEKAFQKWIEAKSIAERNAEEDYARWLMVEFAGEIALCEQMEVNEMSARNAEREYAIWEEIVVIGDVGREKVLEREGRVRKEKAFQKRKRIRKKANDIEGRQAARIIHQTDLVEFEAEIAIHQSLMGESDTKKQEESLKIASWKKHERELYQTRENAFHQRKKQKEVERLKRSAEWAAEKKRIDAQRKRASKKAKDKLKKVKVQRMRGLLEIEDSFRLLASTRVMEVPLIIPSLKSVAALTSELKRGDHISQAVKLLDQSVDFRILKLVKIEEDFQRVEKIRGELKILLLNRASLNLHIAEKKRFKQLLEYVLQGSLSFN